MAWTIIGSHVVSVLWVRVELSPIYIETLGICVGNHELEALRKTPLKLTLYRVVIAPELILVALNCAIDEGEGFTGRLSVWSHVLRKWSIVTNRSPQAPAHRTHVSDLETRAIGELPLNAEIILQGIRDLTVRIPGAPEDRGCTFQERCCGGRIVQEGTRHLPV